jgi:hypothetical protein
VLIFLPAKFFTYTVFMFAAAYTHHQHWKFRELAIQFGSLPSQPLNAQPSDLTTPIRNCNIQPPNSIPTKISSYTVGCSKPAHSWQLMLTGPNNNNMDWVAFLLLYSPTDRLSDRMSDILSLDIAAPLFFLIINIFSLLVFVLRLSAVKWALLHKYLKFIPFWKP